MSDRYDLGQKEIDALLAENDAKRFDYFLHKVPDWGEVWSLKMDGGWVLYGDAKGRQVAPFWPFKEYAEACASADWVGAVPERIDFDSFVNRWLPGLARDQRTVAVFPSRDIKALVIGPLELKRRLEQERSTFLDE